MCVLPRQQIDHAARSQILDAAGELDALLLSPEPGCTGQMAYSQSAAEVAWRTV